MAQLLDRRRSRTEPDRDRVRVVAFRMYPDGGGMIRVHRGRSKRSVLNIELTPAEADAFASAFTRTRS